MMPAIWLLCAALGAALAPAVGPATDPVDNQETIDRLAHELEKIDHAIDDTKAMIRVSLDAVYLPDLYFRLAELYVERSRYEHAKGIAQQGSGARTLSDTRSMGVALSKKLALETYQKVLSDFPEYEHLDQIYFFRGHEYRELGQYDDLEREYDALIGHFPRSKWAMHARLVRADYHFDKGEYDAAEKGYRELLAQPPSEVQPMARYKLGWIKVYQQNYRDALDLLRDAVLTSNPLMLRRSFAESKLNIRQEALMAMTWPYSETRKPDGALAYFRPLADSKSNYLAALKKLASRYTLKSKTQAAALVLREVVRLNYDAEQNLQYVPSIVNAVQDLPPSSAQRYDTVAEDVRSVTTTIEAIVDRPEPMKSRSDAPPLAEGALASEYELHARDMATRAQKFAQQRRDIRLDRRAARAYADYLRAFPSAKERNAIRLDRANALFEAADFLPSGMEYERVANADTGKGRQTEVYNAIVGYYKALEEDAKRRLADSSRTGTLDKLELLRAREGLKQLGGYFAKQYPNSAHVADVRFNVARMYYQQGEFARAAELFGEFIKLHPTHRDVATAGRLALDGLFKLEKLEDMAALADAFAKNVQITNGDFRAEAARLAEAARRRKIETTVIGTSDADFSKKMLSEWEKNKGSKEGEQFLIAGFSKYKAQGDVFNTFAFGDKLMGAYPNSRYAPDALVTMGNFAIQIADFERAAWMYEEYQKRYASQSAAAGLLQNAADTRLLLGELRQAEQDFTTLRQQGSDEQKHHATEKLVQMYAMAGAWGQLAAAADAFVAEDKTVTSCFYAGLAAYKQNDEQQAAARFACAQKASPQNDVEESLQARAAFMNAKLAASSFERVAFHGARGAEQVLQRKLQALGEAEQGFVAAINTGDSRWGMAATYELSRLYRNFAAFLNEAPVPDGTSAAEYKAALKEQADPYVDKAQQTLVACAQKSEQLRLLTPYGAACMRGATAAVDEKEMLPQRAAVANNARYQQDIDALRKTLARNLHNQEAMVALARRAMVAQDYHFARLVLLSAQEGDAARGKAKQIDAWMGLVLWQLGDPQAAQEYLERARRAGIDAAALNLAGLYHSFGYSKLARGVLADNPRAQSVDPGGFDIHPAARAALRGKDAE